MNMKTKLVTVVSVVAVSWLALIFSGAAVGQESSSYKPPSGASQAGAAPGALGAGGASVATPVTPGEAAKKYPAATGHYPVGERDPHKPSGVITSPYPPHKDFDCSKIAHGGLVLDTRANKVFVRP